MWRRLWRSSGSSSATHCRWLVRILQRERSRRGAASFEEKKGRRGRFAKQRGPSVPLEMRTFDSQTRYSRGSPLVYARRVRACAARVLHGWAPLLALVLFGGALVLLASSYVVPGCCALAVAVIATWVGEVWVTPRGNDAYARRMRNIVKARVAVLNADSAVRRDRLRDLRDTIFVLEPPPYYAERHRAVCDRIEALAHLEAENGGLEDRAVYAHAINQGVRTILREPGARVIRALRSGAEACRRGVSSRSRRSTQVISGTSGAECGDSKEGQATARLERGSRAICIGHRRLSDGCPQSCGGVWQR